MQDNIQIDGESVAKAMSKPPLERGTKFECGKPKPSFVPYDVIAWLARVLEYGAEKYERDNWKRLDSEADQLKILDALERHVGEYKSGHRYDAESKMPVLAHVFTNTAFLLFFQVAAGGEGSNPHKLSEEQSKALKDARELGLRLREEAKRKDCDKIDASELPFVVAGRGKLERIEAIGRSTVPPLEVLEAGRFDSTSFAEFVRKSGGEISTEDAKYTPMAVRKFAVKLMRQARNSSDAAIAHAQDGAATRAMLRELQAQIDNMQRKDSK